MARGAVETLATRFCDGAVAPVFWYAVLGLPGIFAFRAVNVMVYGLGDKSGAFGITAARLDRVLNILPAPFCGVVICVSAAFTPAANPVRAFKMTGAAVQGRAAFVAPWTLGALAGALGPALGGPRRNAEKSRTIPGSAMGAHAPCRGISAGRCLLPSWPG